MSADGLVTRLEVLGSPTYRVRLFPYCEITQSHSISPIEVRVLLSSASFLSFSVSSSDQAPWFSRPVLGMLDNVPVAGGADCTGATDG